MKKLVRHTAITKLLRQDQRGVIIIGAFIVTFFFLVASMSVAEFSINHLVDARRTLIALNALSVAEAGAEDVMYRLNQDTTYGGSGGDVEFYNDNVKGRGVYNTTVSPGQLANEKVVISTGKIYLPANAAQPKVTRKVRLILQGTEPFVYAVQSGNSGPIYLYGNTGINAPANIFTNKYIRVQDATVNIAGEIFAADKDPTAGYAAFNCSIDGNNHISGATIKVRYNVNNANCGINTSGSTLSQNDASVVPQNLPTVDKAAILAGISTTTTCSNAATSPYQISNTTYQNGDGSACNVSLDKNKPYLLKGNAYIKGNLTVDGDAIQADSSLTSDVYVIVDGAITFKGNSTSISTNTNNIAITFVSYSTIDSLGNKTQPNAIDISGNSVSLLGRFLALSGSLGFKGRGSLGPIAATSIVMDGSGSVTFQPVNSIPQNPTGWDVKYYEQIYQ